MQTPSPVHLEAVDAPGQPAPSAELEELYRGFEKALLVPLWTEIGDLMPLHPQSKAAPYLWQWRDLVELAGRAGELVPVGRGGERRAIALANPNLGGKPYATPTLWAAIQYLMPGEDAPEHRHTQNAFRSWSRATVCGRWLSATRCRCAAATSSRRRAGTGTPTTTRRARRWRGSTAWTSPCSTRSRASSSSPAAKS